MTPSPSVTPSVTPTPNVTPTPTPSANPTPSVKPKPSVTPTPSVKPTQSVKPKPCPSPTAIPNALRGKDLTRLPTTSRVVALTFDAGANADGVASIVSALATQSVPATFFLTGRWVSVYPDLARSLGASYDVGNHTQTHPHLPALTDAAIQQEITAAASAITQVTGANPRPLFRFPFGDADAATIAVVNGCGYVGIRWTVDTLGWKGTSGGQSARSVTDRVLASATAGQIVLMHVGSNPDDGSTLDADALPGIIAGLRERGYAFVTVRQGLGLG